MAGVSERPVLYVVACGGRAAGDLPDFVTTMPTDQGWEVCVIATPSALKFLDAPNLAGLTGHPVRSEYKQPDEPDVLPPPDAMVVAPAWVCASCSTLSAELSRECGEFSVP